MNKTLTLAALLLTACGTPSTFLSGIPALNDGDDEFWAYYCDGGAKLQINYANMGGEYSATPKLKTGKRVLAQRSTYDFSDGEYRWTSDDGGHHFRLMRGEESLYSQCGGRRKIDKDAILIR